MSQTQQRDPGRFQPEYGLDPDRDHNRLEAAGAAAALFGLLVGVPLLLLVLSGPPPLPTGVPSISDLTGRLGIEQLLSVLVVIVWLAWLQFAVCAAVEVVAALRGGVLAAPVPWSGPSQRLARVLVGSVLLAGTLAVSVGPAQAAVGPGGSPGAVATSSASAQPGTTPPAASVPAAARQRQDSAEKAYPDDDLVGKRVYVVHPPKGLHHDSLWDIAERHLGEGRRYREIYALNHGRTQPDGTDLHLARLIQPGWQLIMPEDAKGVPRYQAPAVEPSDGEPSAQAQGEQSRDRPSATAEQSQAQPSATVEASRQAQSSQQAPTTQSLGLPGPGASPAATQRSTQGPQPTRSAERTSAPATQKPDQNAKPDQNPEPTGEMMPAPGYSTPELEEDVPAFLTRWPATNELVGAGMVAASMLALLALIRLRRNGGTEPDEDDVETEVVLRAAAAGDRGSLLELAVRSLPGTCHANGRPLPQAHAAIVEDDAIDLVLTVPQPTAPSPWAVLDNGERWRLERAVAGGLDSGGESAYPLLVGIGRDDRGRDVLINLGAAGGPVLLTGDLQAAAGIARALTLGLSANPWSRGIDVLVSGMPQELPLLSAGRITMCSDDGELTDRLIRDDAATPPRTTAEILSGAPLPGTRPERVAVYGTGLESDLAARVVAATNHRSDLAVVVVGDLASARWRLDCDADGRLSCPPIGLELTAHRLADDTLQQLHALFTTATRPPALNDPDANYEPGQQTRGVVTTVVASPVPASAVQPISVPSLSVGAAGSGHPFDPGPLDTGSMPALTAAAEEADAEREAAARRTAGHTAERPVNLPVEVDVPIEAHDEPLFRPQPRGRRAGGPRPISSTVNPDNGPDDTVWSSATARIALLGEIDVQAPGPLEEARRPIAEEVVTYLALHRAGVHPSVLGAALWPLGVTPDVRQETIDLVKRWLGEDQDGAPILREGHDSRLRLSPRMPCDWDVVRTLVSRTEHGLPPAMERDLLTRALHLVRGQVAGGVVTSGYSWLPRTGIQRQADGLVLRTAGHLASLCSQDGDFVAAAHAAGAGLRAVPTDQEMWRHVIRAEHGLGGQARLLMVVDQLRFTLSTMGVDVEPKTTALIEHLTSDLDGPQSRRWV